LLKSRSRGFKESTVRQETDGKALKTRNTDKACEQGLPVSTERFALHPNSEN